GIEGVCASARVGAVGASSTVRLIGRGWGSASVFFFKQKTAYDIGLGIPAEPLFRSASNIGISQSTFSVKVLNLFSRSRRKTNKRKSKHSAMLRNKETRHRMFIGLLNTTRKLA